MRATIWGTISFAASCLWLPLVAAANPPPIPPSSKTPLLFASRAPLMCVGPETSQRRFVYLHGLDSPDPSKQEVRIRIGLAETAEALNARLAIVRAWDTCKGNKLCWNYREPKALAKTWHTIQEAAADCFPPPDRRKAAKLPPLKDAVVVGFSNGGYLAGALFKKCLAPELGLLVTIGAAGKVKDARDELKDCGAIRVMIGRRDQTHAAALIFAKALAHRGADSAALEYDGGHDVPQSDLRAVLKEHWRAREAAKRGPIPPPTPPPKTKK